MLPHACLPTASNATLPVLQTHLITLAGAPVALAAHGHQLAAVWHAAAPTASGDQCLQYALYDVAGTACTVVSC